MDAITETKSTPQIAGFWRRVLGCLIDSAVLGAVGMAMGLFLSDVFMQMGGWARLVGFGIGLLYFGILNSRVGNGQTLGKRVARTKVVSSSGATLGLGRSFLRFTILAAPLFLNHARIPPQLLTTWLGVAISVLLFGVGVSTIYLLVFNRRTRQGLHDLAVGSFVIKAPADSSAINSQINKAHYVVVAALILASAILPSFLLARFGGSDFFAPLLSVQGKVMEHPDISYASVSEGQNFFSAASGTKRTTGVGMNVILKRRVPNDEALADEVARTLFKSLPRAAEKDVVSIVVTSGFDIGIASGWSNHVYAHSPAQWQARLGSH